MSMNSLARATFSILNLSLGTKLGLRNDAFSSNAWLHTRLTVEVLTVVPVRSKRLRQKDWRDREGFSRSRESKHTDQSRPASRIPDLSHCDGIVYHSRIDDTFSQIKLFGHCRHILSSLCQLACLWQPPNVTNTSLLFASLKSFLKPYVLLLSHRTHRHYNTTILVSG
jgi:hypothetical protein